MSSWPRRQTRWCWRHIAKLADVGSRPRIALPAVAERDRHRQLDAKPYASGCAECKQLLLDPAITDDVDQLFP